MYNLYRVRVATLKSAVIIFRPCLFTLYLTINKQRFLLLSVWETANYSLKTCLNNNPKPMCWKPVAANYVFVWLLISCIALTQFYYMYSRQYQLVITSDNVFFCLLVCLVVVVWYFLVIK